MHVNHIRRAIDIVDKYAEQMKDQEYLHLCNSLMMVHNNARAASGELQKLNTRINNITFLLSRAKVFPSVTDELRIQSLFSFCMQHGLEYKTTHSPGDLGILPSEVDDFYESYRVYHNVSSCIMKRRLEAELSDLQELRERIYSYM